MCFLHYIYIKMGSTRGRLNLMKLGNFCVVWIILINGILIELCSEELKESLVHSGCKIGMQSSKETCGYCFLYRPRCWNIRKYSSNNLHELRGRYSLNGLKEDVCKVIKNYGIKRKFRGTRGRTINQLKSIKRNWDSNMGVHTNLLRQLKKVPIGYDNKNNLGLAIFHARSLCKKT